jgi:hypothetical protein
MKLSATFNELLGNTAASNPEDFFGFNHRQIEAVHFHKQGVGAGIWFRCGRVIDEIAAPTCRDPGLYDYAAG